MLRTHAVVPVKGLDHAKTRLASVLDAEARRQLASRFVNDTLSKLGASCIERVHVVTAHREVADRARQLGALVVHEPSAVAGGPREGHATLNAALEAGRTAAIDHGAEALLTLPIDLLMLPAFDLDAVLDRVASRDFRGIAIETDDRGDGTNFLLQSPCSALPFCYGKGSHDAHRNQANSLGVEVIAINAVPLRYDLDHPEDPEKLAKALADGEPTLLHHFHTACEIGTALPFLLDTPWAEPLRQAAQR